MQCFLGGTLLPGNRQNPLLSWLSTDTDLCFCTEHRFTGLTVGELVRCCAPSLFQTLESGKKICTLEIDFMQVTEVFLNQSNLTQHITT